MLRISPSLSKRDGIIRVTYEPGIRFRTRNARPRQMKVRTPDSGYSTGSTSYPNPGRSAGWW
jgi:hypothetical protein